MRASIVVSVALLGFPAAADDCVYRYGFGPQTLQVVGDVDAVRVSNGAETVTCPVVLDTPGSGLFALEPKWLAGCPQHAGELTFVSLEPSGIDFPIIVFHGNTFYRDPSCDRTAP